MTASKLAGIQYATVTVALNGGGVTGVANCPAGLNVIGGGATLTNQQVSFVNDSGPTGTRTGWTATGFGEPGTTSMTVTAICTAAASVSG